MKVSLVICTHNRAGQLSDLFLSLERLSRDIEFEVVFVDNNSTDATRAKLEEFARHATFPITLSLEPIAGAGRARNTGWQRSKGEIVVFTDDDCYPDALYLVRMNECFSENPSIGFIGGRVLLFDPTDFRITIQESVRRVDFSPKSYIAAGIIHGANFGFRRTALEACGGFDVLFGPGARFVCEDVDILARLSDAGWHGAYDPRPVVSHHHRRKTIAEANGLMRVYDRGRGAYFAKSILTLSQRVLYLKEWRYRLREQHWSVSRRELFAAAEYLVWRVWHFAGGR